MRGPRRQFVHSKVMAWIALDRAVRAVDNGWIRADATWWRTLRDEIHNQVCLLGFDSGLNSFVQFYGSHHLDASLLMMPRMGFLPADDLRMLGTVKAIEENLIQNDFVGRYTLDPAVDGCRMARASSWPAPSGWPITMFCRVAGKTASAYSRGYSRFAMRLDCCRKNMTRSKSGCWGIFRRHSPMWG
jgi:GH15 family glucan-1,4-alpha-glucosidase